MILAADIGATKTRLAVFSRDKGPLVPIHSETLPTTQFDGILGLIEKFLGGIPPNISLKRACLAVAAPISGGVATMINLPWVFDEKQLASRLGMPVKFLNDLEATANAILSLGHEELYTINRGVPEPGGSIGVIAPGTGLGEAYLTWDGSRYRAYASEGGHVEFGPRSFLEMELLGWIHTQLEHVSYERVCSGLGIHTIYSFLKDRGLRGGTALAFLPARSSRRHNTPHNPIRSRSSKRL